MTDPARTVDFQALTAAGHDRIGSALAGKWQLTALLGIGGTASVYAAVHRNGYRAAIKLLHPHLAVDDEVRARLVREGFLANLTDHPGAVRVLDDDRTDDGSTFLVMELLEGEQVEARRHRQGGHLSAIETLELASSLLDILAAAHDKDIVHRDIKPENLFITREGQLKLLDFGIARIAGEPDDVPLMARTGFGTPSFLAPEQAMARVDQVDGQTDLWAVGATMFTLLTGQEVHQGATVGEQVARSATMPAVALSTVLPGVPAGVAAIVDRALAFEKRDRWATAGAMKEAVDAELVALRAREADARPWLGRPRTRKVLARVLPACAAVAMLFVLLSGMWRRSTPPPSVGPTPVLVRAPGHGRPVIVQLPSRREPPVSAPPRKRVNRPAAVAPTVSVDD